MNKSQRKGWPNQYVRLHACKIKVSENGKGPTFNICSTSSESEALNDSETKFQSSEPFYTTTSPSFRTLEDCQKSTLDCYNLSLKQMNFEFHASCATFLRAVRIAD